MAYMKVQFRRDTEANWLLHDPILLEGEMALVTDAKPPHFKLGDGVKRFSELDAVNGTPGEKRKLTGNTTVYIRADGDDNNDGLADTPERALKTVDGVYEWFRKTDVNNFALTFSFASGNYGSISFTDNNPSGLREFTITSTEQTNPATFFGIVLQGAFVVNLRGTINLLSTGTGANVISLSEGVQVHCLGVINFSGSGARAVYVELGAKMRLEYSPAGVLNLNNFTAANVIIEAAQGGQIISNSAGRITGSATGRRFRVSGCSNITLWTDANAANLIPGTMEGTVQWDDGSSYWGLTPPSILIPNGADLNSYTKTGTYYCQSTASLATLLNMPSYTGTAFAITLFVEDGVIPKQTLTIRFNTTDNPQTRIFTRWIYSDNYDSYTWEEQTSEFKARGDLTTATSTPPDSLVVPGCYYVNNAWTTLPNGPADKNGHFPNIYQFGTLLVFDAGNATNSSVKRQITQMYISHKGEVIQRHQYLGYWATKYWYAIDGKRHLTADTSVYVDGVNGDDTNSGLNISNALKTMTGVCNWFRNTDTHDFQVTVYFTSGEYIAGSQTSTIDFRGATFTSYNINAKATIIEGIWIHNTKIIFKDIMFKTTTNLYCIYESHMANIAFQGQVIFSGSGAGALEVRGNSIALLYGEVNINNYNVTNAGEALITAVENSSIYVPRWYEGSGKITGIGTGRKFFVLNNSNIKLQSAAAITSLPGTIDGYCNWDDGSNVWGLSRKVC